MRLKKKGVLMAVIALLWGGWGGGQGVAQGQAITIAGKNFTEQYILAELGKLVLEEAGFRVNLRTGIGTAIARQALEAGEVDLYFEYTGTAYTVFYQQDDHAIMTDPQKVYNWVRDNDAERGLLWLDPMEFNNTYTIMMRRADSEARGVKTISDFAAHAEQRPEEITFALEVEFWERPDGFRALMAHYDFELPMRAVKRMDMGLTYLALRDGQVSAAMGFATDGRIPAFGLVGLEDDRNFFPFYNPAPVIRSEVLAANPEIRELLRPLAEKLDTDAIRRLNREVDVEHRGVGPVAREWLREVGLL